MPEDRVSRRALRGPRRRYLLLLSALACTVLLVLSGCMARTGSQSASGPDSSGTSASNVSTSTASPSGAAGEDAGTGWKVFRAAAYQWQVKFSLMQIGPPWATAVPLVSYLRPGAEAPEYKGKLPVNTLIAPAEPTNVHPLGAFGYRTAPDIGVHELHNGADLAAENGSPVVAAMDGVVRAVFWDAWGGNRVEVAHVGGMKTTYNHLSEVSVKEEDVLKASQRLGSVGASGARVTGPHLHFETWVDNKAVDPQSFDWIVGDRVIKAPREPGQDVPTIERGGPGDESRLSKVTDCPHAEDAKIECGAPDAVDKAERCATGDAGTDCPGAVASQREKCVVLSGGGSDCDPSADNGPSLAEEEKPVEEVPPVEEDTGPVEEVPPVEMTEPAEDVPPVEEVPPVKEVPPVEVTDPAEDVPPVEETAPAGGTASEDAQGVP